MAARLQTGVVQPNQTILELDAVGPDNFYRRNVFDLVICDGGGCQHAATGYAEHVYASNQPR